MSEEQIPAFIDELLATGCPVYAVGQKAYVIAEFAVPECLRSSTSERVNKICQRFGERDHLILQIVHHLWSIGRGIQVVDDMVH
ncbi:MAG: hypothetical protein O9256_03590 [Rhizobiaceae bacterium]|nr:hypothetical protein [Rhizobiaceae bacterium]MCZ8352737.1 hypothetical protein [Rhizobium sp.]